MEQAIGKHLVRAGFDTTSAGGGGQGKKTPPKDPCPPDKRRFFDWLVVPLTKMAQALDVDKKLLLTQAAKEGGWNKQGLDHNQPLNNPFGVNKIEKGHAAGNVAYKSLDLAIDYWKRKYGDRVRGAQTPGHKMQNPSKDQGQPYNSDPLYESTYKARYNDLLRHMKNCGIQ